MRLPCKLSQLFNHFSINFCKLQFNFKLAELFIILFGIHFPEYKTYL
jgi:hypothetical protein